jgi:hypothetical protein
MARILDDRSLTAQIDSLIAEEASLAQQDSEGVPQGPSAVEVADWARDLGTFLRAGTAHQRKALFRLLVRELRVISKDEILPTYKIPALVRAPEGLVDLARRCVNCLPLLAALRSQPDRVQRAWR